VQDQLLARFVEAGHGPLWVVGQGEHIQHVLHRLHERSVVHGRNAEAFHRPGLDFIFSDDARWFR
jgi:hypothetical protein